MGNTEYKFLELLGVSVEVLGESGPGFVKNTAVKENLHKLGLTAEEFGAAFGTQTCPVKKKEDGNLIRGYYPWDAERALRQALTTKGAKDKYCSKYLTEDDNPATGEHYWD